MFQKIKPLNPKLLSYSVWYYPSMVALLVRLNTAVMNHHDQKQV